MLKTLRKSGFSLIEVLVVSGLVAILLIGIFVGFRLAVELTTEARAQSTALSLASGQMEFIRSLEYNEIGTIGGIPDGPIPQIATTTVSGREYTIRTLIYWVDDPADGLGVDDVNSITTDYKEAKVEVSWEQQRGTTRSLFLLSRITPAGIESNVGGGTIRIEVYDRSFTPLPDAVVRLRNDTTTTTIDVTQNTNIDGRSVFPGAPSASQYEVIVTRPGFSTDQTRRPTSTLPNPDTQPFTVVEGETTILSFQIDRTSDLLVRTFAPAVTTAVADDFTVPTTVASTTNTTLIADTYELASSAGQYFATGTIQSNFVSPGTISRWDMASYFASTTFDTTTSLQVVSLVGTSSIALVPNEDLPGNSGGFSPGSVDLSDLDPTTYPSLALVVTLGTASSTLTPRLHNWSLSYVEFETPQSAVPIRVRGNKTIGTDGDGASVFKYDQVHTSDGAGQISLTDMEWDTYHLTPQTGWAVVSACPPIPYDLSPGVSDEIRLYVVSDPTPSLRVQVVSGSSLIPGATVEVLRSGFTATATTDTCGQAFFSAGVTNEDDYTVRVTAPGYAEEVATNVEVTGTSNLIMSISP